MLNSLFSFQSLNSSLNFKQHESFFVCTQKCFVKLRSRKERSGALLSSHKYVFELYVEEFNVWKKFLLQINMVFHFYSVTISQMHSRLFPFFSLFFAAVDIYENKILLKKVFSPSSTSRRDKEHTRNNQIQSLLFFIKSLPWVFWIEVRINWKSVIRIMEKSAANSRMEKVLAKLIICFLTLALFTGIQLELMLDCSLKLPSNVSAISCYVYLYWFLFMIAKHNGDKDWKKNILK